MDLWGLNHQTYFTNVLILLPERIIPESTCKNEPAINSDYEAITSHFHLLAEIVAKMSSHLMSRRV